MSAILIKPDSKHKIRNYFQLTARRKLFSFQCSTLSTSHNPNNKDNNSSPTYPDEHIPQRDHHFLSFGEAVYFDCPDLCSYLGFGLCPGFLRDCYLDRWDRIRFVGDGKSETVGFKPGFRLDKVGFCSGSVCGGCAVLNCGVLDDYKNEGVTVDDCLLDDYGVFLMRGVRGCITAVPADGAGCDQQEDEEISCRREQFNRCGYNCNDPDRKSGLNAEHHFGKQDNAHRPNINDDIAERLTQEI